MSMNNPIPIHSKNGEWAPVCDEESLSYLLALTAPTHRASEAAHGLLRKFGSTTNVIRAPVHELRNVQGVCIDIANTLKVVQSIHLGFLWRQLNVSRFPGCSIQIENWCREYLCSEEVDVCLAVCYSFGEFSGATPYTTGTLGHVKIYPREILKFALQHSANSIVVVFVRKHGTPEMTRSEQNNVLNIRKAALALDIEVSDVIVIADH